MYISTFKTSGKLNLSVTFPMFDKCQKGERGKHYPSKLMAFSYRVTKKKKKSKSPNGRLFIYCNC